MMGGERLPITLTTEENLVMTNRINSSRISIYILIIIKESTGEIVLVVRILYDLPN